MSGTNVISPVERMRVLNKRAEITVNYKLTNIGGATSVKPYVPIVTISYINGGGIQYRCFNND